MLRNAFLQLHLEHVSLLCLQDPQSVERDIDTEEEALLQVNLPSMMSSSTLLHHLDR